VAAVHLVGVGMIQLARPDTSHQVLAMVVLVAVEMAKVARLLQI
jgi:hypothetical protein